MCVTTLEAELKKTRIGVWDILHPEFGYRHVLAYQNQAQNLADQPNCMLLHIPSKSPLKPECIINTENDVELLLNMEKPFVPVCRAFGAQNHVVEMGVYHIALLNDCSEDALEITLMQIPESKRPRIPSDFLDFYSSTFPGFPLVLCCFNNKDAKKASPVMLHFEPKFPDTFMFNTLDCHGGIPDLDEEIQFHQTIITGSYKLKKEGNGFKAFPYQNVSEELLPWLPKYGTAMQVDSVLPNRDLLVGVKGIQEGGDAVVNLGILTEN